MAGDVDRLSVVRPAVLELSARHAARAGGRREQRVVEGGLGLEERRPARRSVDGGRAAATTGTLVVEAELDRLDVALARRAVIVGQELARVGDFDGGAG